MPVPEQTPVATFTGNGVTTDFSFAFGASSAAHVFVEIDGVALVRGVDFTVLAIDDASGTVQITPAPAAGAAVAVGRRTPLKRVDIDYQEGGAFLADTVDLDFNTLWRAVQELGYELALAPRLALGSPLAGLVRFPAPGAGRFLRWNALGNALEAVDVETAASVSTLRADLASPVSVDEGDALVVVKQPFAGSISRTQHQKNAEFVSVADFGAIGDGVTDDSAAFQAAVTASKNVVVPAGTYSIGTAIDLRSGSVLRGMGRPKLVARAAGQHLISGDSLAGVMIDGIDFEGVDSATVPTGSVGAYSGNVLGLVTLVACSDVSIEHCSATKFYSGFVAIKCSRLWIERNTVTHWTLYAVLASLSVDFTIERNVLVGCDQAGAANAYGVSATGNEGGGDIQKACSISFNTIRDVPSWDGVMTHDVSALRVIGNDIRNVRTGVDIGHVNSANFVRDIQVVGNYIESCSTNTWGATGAGHAGILLSGYDATHLLDDAVVAGNIVRGFFKTVGMVSAGNPSNISIAFAARAVVQGNVVRDSGAVMTPAGIYVAGNNDGLSISGNSLQGSMPAGGVRLASLVADAATVVANSIRQTTASDPAVSITGSTIGSLALDANASNSTVPVSQSSSTVTLAGAGSFTVALTGCGTAPTGTANYVVAGGMVTISFPSVSGASNSTSCTLTGLPAHLQPRSQFASCPIAAQDNGVYSNDFTAAIAPGSGTITLNKGGVSTGWTGSGAKGVFGSTITYSLA